MIFGSLFDQIYKAWLISLLGRAFFVVNKRQTILVFNNYIKLSIYVIPEWKYSRKVL